MEPGRWNMSQGLVIAGRSDVATLSREDGMRIVVYYNQVVLDAGPRDSGVAHYFGSVGRIRPDWTVQVFAPNGERRSVVGEVKLTENTSYERTGFSEAVLYRFEYAKDLTGWLKSVLVVPGTLPGAPRRGDATIALGWPDWVPGVVLEGILEGVGPGAR